MIILHETIPPIAIHVLCGFYALIAFVIGCVVYKKFNYRFVYYM